MMRNQLVETEETESYIDSDAGTVARSSKGKAAKRSTAAEQRLGAGSRAAAEQQEAVADGAERGGEAGNRAAAEQQQSSGETAGIGVQSQISRNDFRGENGQLMAGHPVLPGAGRPKGSGIADKTPDIRAAIWKRYTLEEIFGRLDTAYRIAVEMKSSRGIVAAVTPIMEYGLGKPIQQVVHEAGRTELLEQLFEAKDTPLLPAAGALLLPVTGDEA